MEPKRITLEEARLISKIAGRAVRLLNKIRFNTPIKEYQFLDIREDIQELHSNTNPMRLVDWFESDECEFMHDIIGIFVEIDRNACTLKNGFVPRFIDGDEYRRRNSEAEVEEILANEPHHPHDPNFQDDPHELESDPDERGKPDPTDLPNIPKMWRTDE